MLSKHAEEIFKSFMIVEHKIVFRRGYELAQDEAKAEIEKLRKALSEIRFNEQKYIDNSPEETTMYLEICDKALQKDDEVKE